MLTCSSICISIYHAPNVSLYNSCLQFFTLLSWKYPKHRNAYSQLHCSQIMADRYMCSITVGLNFKELLKNILINHLGILVALFYMLK